MIEADTPITGLYQKVFQLPFGAILTTGDAPGLAGLIRHSHLHAEALRSRV